MSPTELEAARRLLFFSPPEAAALISQTREQSWRRWEGGTRGVPDDVVARIRFLLDWRKMSIADARAQIQAQGAGKTAIVWYASAYDFTSLDGREEVFWRPHQSACATLSAEFPDSVTLVAFDGPAYAAWLGRRKDSESMRGAWAHAVANNAAPTSTRKEG